jgi:hypothetical protein
MKHVPGTLQYRLQAVLLLLLQAVLVSINCKQVIENAFPPIVLDGMAYTRDCNRVLAFLAV